MDHDEAGEFFKEAMAAFRSGDPQRVARYWAPSLTWYGLHRSGGQREYQGLDGLARAVAEPPPVVEMISQTVQETWLIGMGVLAARVLARRRAVATGEEIESEFLLAVRIEDGVITRVIDLVDGDLAAFWQRATAAANT